MTDEPDDERAPGSPPHPLDRVWFHPSELGGVVATPEETRPARREWGLVAAAALCGVVATFVVLGVTGALNIGDSGSGTTGSAALVPNFPALGSDRAAVLAATVGASVMAVHATSAFGTASGSGVELGGGRVLTNASLVNGADTVRVTTGSGEVYNAKVVGSDASSDLTVLRVEGGEVPAAPLGSADGLSVGSWVLALGSNGGAHRWAAQGVVSGLGELVTTGTGLVMPGMLATDVTPAPDAGGGPLLDRDGDVVAILSRAAPGRALPIDAARDIADQLSATGRAVHGWLGILAVDATERAGARVAQVTPDGPAADGGLETGDVVSALADDHVTDVADLMAAVALRRPGDPVVLDVWRGGQHVQISVKLGERSPDLQGLAALQG